MKKFLLSILMSLILFSIQAQVHVRGYTRSNGTYVAPYTRSSPGSGSSYSSPSYSSSPSYNYTGNTVNPNSVYVNGYYRSNGTWVDGYYRTAPNNTVRDNYSHYGNVNPYTGAVGTKDKWMEVGSYNYSTSNPANYTTSYYGTGSITSGSVELLSGPSSNNPTIYTFRDGQTVVVLENNVSGWVKVRVWEYDQTRKQNDVYTGYVWKDYISIQPSTVSSSTTITSTSSNYTSNYSITSSSNSQSAISNYEDGKGGIYLWVEDFKQGKIKVYVDGMFLGTLNGGSNLMLTLTGGFHKVKAVCSSKTWNDQIYVETGKCNSHRLGY